MALGPTVSMTFIHPGCPNVASYRRELDMLACFCGSHARRFPGSQLGLEGRMEMKTVKIMVWGPWGLKWHWSWLAAVLQAILGHDQASKSTCWLLHVSPGWWCSCLIYFCAWLLKALAWSLFFIIILVSLLDKACLAVISDVLGQPLFFFFSSHGLGEFKQWYSFISSQSNCHTFPVY